MNVNIKNEKEKENSKSNKSYNFNNYFEKEKEGPENIIKEYEIELKPSQIKSNILKLEKVIFSKFNKKYKIKYNPKRIYNELIMYTLLFNKNTHLVSVFKDYMIYDYVDEFFKRFYTNVETFERLPKFAMFYKNYLTFFCQPCFSDFHYNALIQKNREKKAEIFYNKNFRDNNKESCEDEGLIEDTDDEEEEPVLEKSKIEKTIFNETVKKKIEQYSPINNSMALPESETRLKNDQSGLLISFENESSLKSILKNMINKKKIKNKFDEEISSIKKVKLGLNDVQEKIDKIQKNNKKVINNNKTKNNDKININKNSINKDNKNNKIVKINPKRNNKIFKKAENQL